MPPVDAFSLAGFDLAFLSNDHRPPHFHAVRRGEWEIRVYILTTTADKLHFDVKWPKKPGAGPDRRVLRVLCARVHGHRDALLAEFEQKVNYDPTSDS